MHLHDQIDEAAAYVRRQWAAQPVAGIILGTGLGELARQVTSPVEIPYARIPHFPSATAVGHRGQLVCGDLAGVPVVTMEGRFHSYEGYDADQITLPVRVMNALGIGLLIVSNASGGLNPNFRSGDIMIIEDHINLMNVNPLIGINDDRLGPRLPDMSRPYDRGLIDRAAALARREDFAAHQGVYAALRGPNYETRAEYRFLRRIGADVVGMSTVPEVIVAAHAGLRVLALSTVANMCFPDVLGETSGEEVVAIGNSAEPKLRAIVLGILATEG